MSAPTVQELKKALRDAGFEVFRTRGAEVQLAERPRENQIMEAGISLLTGEAILVRFVVRAQKTDFPKETSEQLLDRAAELGQDTVSRGFSIIERRCRDLPSPSDPSAILDTWFEVVFERSFPALDEALGEVAVLLKLSKVVSGSP